MSVESVRHIAGDRLILLYILDSKNEPISIDEICRIVLTYDMLNYFSIQDSLNDLKTHDFIQLLEKDGKRYYRIAEKGKFTLSHLESWILPSNKRAIDKEFQKPINFISANVQSNAVYYRQENSFLVHVRYMELDQERLNMFLSFDEEDEAISICEKWNEAPELIFKNFLNSLKK